VNTSQPKAPELVTLKIALLKRGWKAPDLAKRVGLSVGAVRNILCGNNNNFGQHKPSIEDILGEPIWSTPEEFSRRNQSKKSNKR
jgi:transcriptional regulator with XRE-family HTH domain